MSRRMVQTSERTYLVAGDDAPPLGGRLWALVTLCLIDELTGGPPSGSITIRARERSLVPRLERDGIVGLVGIPQKVFPGLKTIHLTVSADGYMARGVEVQVATDLQFPKTFTPPPLLDLFLHREPIVIAGRTVRISGNTTTPLAGATVSVTGIWLMAPPANMVVPADPPNLVSLRPPLYAGRAAGLGGIQRRDLLPPIAGNDKLLLEDVLTGDNPLLLSNRLNLAPGDILLIDAGQPDITEFLAIRAMTGLSMPDQPARVMLDYPVAHPHRRNAVVQKASPQPLGAVQQFSVEALTGDTCVFLNTVAGLATANEVQITGGSPDEYHSLKRFSVTSDADGYYRLPPLNRVAQLEIDAEKIVGPQTFKATKVFRPDYQQRENRLDLTLTV